ncbi:hypothetical protein OHA18_01200 [Kribbella sp. NBC_00709]|uniref:hypothetical protein n=1 Tax=Kribbella sp. NBC_00709 TaxID=2975972 RepID=UPI002E2A5DAD|nr:hypothetical protein [Kribbella sp. NBC_00709]
MSQPDDADLNVLKAPLPSRHEVDAIRQLRFQLLGYATALGVLITLTPTWLIREYSRGDLRLYSGFGMAHDARILGSAANWLFIVYLVLTLVALATPTTVAAFACAYAGLVDTVVIVLLKPGGEDGADLGWTGAPFLAIGLWLVLAVINHIGWYDINRRG